jgi:hypothetical protein
MPSRTLAARNDLAIRSIFEYAQQSRAFNHKNMDVNIQWTSTVSSGKTGFLNSYLNLLVQEGLVAKETADSAWQAWRDLDNYFLGELPVPGASPGPDGQILYTWDKGDHHLEIEFFACEPTTVFCMDRATGFAEERDLTDASLALFLEFLIKPYRAFPREANHSFGEYTIPQRQELNKIA